MKRATTIIIAAALLTLAAGCGRSERPLDSSDQASKGPTRRAVASHAVFTKISVCMIKAGAVVIARRSSWGGIATFPGGRRVLWGYLTLDSVIQEVLQKSTLRPPVKARANACLKIL